MEIKEEKEFKKKNKKYLAARHETDKYVKVNIDALEGFLDNFIRKINF